MKVANIIAGLILLAGMLAQANAQPLAFPGAEGFGKHATGGRGGQVVIVDNLNDDGPGSLRSAIEMKGPRIVVFRISGTIGLESELEIKQGDLTVAGQSAPGDGICLKNYPVSVEADNVVLRYLRFRMGDEGGQQADALGGINGRENIIIDHCSVSWSTDECATFYRNRNFTMQWCIISESLNESVHEKGAHGYGGIWGGEGASFHHNLLASHRSRLPRFSGSASTRNPEDELVDFRNNVVYNWQSNSSYGGEQGRYNVVNNYYKPGPATQKSKRARIVNPWSPYGGFYVAGNVVYGNEAVTADNWNGGVICDHPDSAYVSEPFQVVEIDPQPAQQAYEAVLQFAGASFSRDAVDARLVEEVRTGKSVHGKNKNGIIDSQRDVGGWPELKSEPAPADKDHDGMPDNWELAQGLDPEDGSDAMSFGLNKNYTNVEMYLNSLVKSVYK